MNFSQKVRRFFDSSTSIGTLLPPPPLKKNCWLQKKTRKKIAARSAKWLDSSSSLARYIFIIKLKSLDKKYNVHPQTDKVKAKKMHTLYHRQFYSRIKDSLVYGMLFFLGLRSYIAMWGVYCSSSRYNSCNTNTSTTNYILLLILVICIDIAVAYNGSPDYFVSWVCCVILRFVLLEYLLLSREFSYRLWATTR